MGRELQKRKNRSSRATVRQPVRRKRALNPSGNALISKNWNKKETLSQNYKRLGLTAKLGHNAGGVEPELTPSATSSSSSKESTAQITRKDPLKSKSTINQVYSEAKVERDPETGKIIRIISSRPAARSNPLNDPLAQFDEPDSDAESEEEAEEWGGFEEDKQREEDRPAVIRELERQANLPREKRVRHQSERELEWLQTLVGKHGDDVGAMARDAKLNPMQQTRADIAKRLRKAGLVSS